MSISQKAIMKIIREEKDLTFTSLYKKLNEVHPTFKKKRLRTLLGKLHKKNKIQYLKGGNRIGLARGNRSKSRRLDRSHPINDFNFIVKKYELQPQFPKNVLMASLEIAKRKVRLTEERTDFTNQQIITIDGEDAKDFDDAVYLEKTDDGGYLLYVHIADVSYYVKERSPVDNEAFERGNSYYLIDKVIPMLPQSLSNGICSLKPNKKRYTVSVKMLFDKDINVIDKEFYTSIIESKRRCTYEDAEKTLNTPKEELPEDLQAIQPMLTYMKELADKLTEKRMSEGSLDLETKELYISTDKRSVPLNIEVKERLSSHKLIEEFMLITNVTVSKYLESLGESIFRVHESPDPEKVESLNRIITKYGFKIDVKENISPMAFQKVLKAVKDKKEKEIIHMHILRTMKQAIYSTENKGHFGLSFPSYTHFTSPIRRYPDLVIHRILKKQIGVEMKAKKCLERTYLDKACDKSSKTERIAVEAEREIIKRKAAHFMKDKVGNVYDGIISGVTNFGFFTELNPYGIEGLCGLRDLRGHYEHDPEHNTLTEQKNNITFSLGMKVKVRVINVNIRRSFIDLELVDEKSYGRKQQNNT
jgi:ribonuclease R